MAKKRKTLPKNFKELVEANDITALKAIYDTCEIDAYNNGFDKSTALHTFGVPEELVRWLAEHGADIEFRDHYNRTPLHVQSRYWNGKVACLIELGADITARDNYGNTPLHIAANNGRTEFIEEFLAHGADVNVENNRKQTPLSGALFLCSNIASLAVAAEVLLNAGAKITPDMAESVERIGKDFEFRRDGFNKEYLPEVDTGLTKLYKLFNVEPVAKRQTYDGTSPIIVPRGKWYEQHEALWQLLVPGSGHATTVQGEVIRTSGKMAREIMDNGGINWDDNFREMLTALVGYFSMGTALASDKIVEAEKLAKRLKSGNGDNEPERLMELAVQWVKANSAPISLGETEYKR